MSRSHSERLLAGARLAGLLDRAGRDVDDGLDRQQRAEHRLGAADAAALLQVVERVEGAEHAGAGDQVVDQGHDLVGGCAVGGRPRPPRRT